MSDQPLIFSFFLIFSGAAVIASMALYTRQPLLVAYILLGALLGPYGSGLIVDTSLITDISHIGIIFLLFLLGLDMQPAHLMQMLKKVTFIAIISSIIFFSFGYTTGFIFGYSQTESMIIGIALMFSSTIICIKLLPTTVLHHRHTGELVVGLLLLQDIIAIMVLLFLYSYSANLNETSFSSMSFITAIISLPIVIASAFIFVKYVLLPLIQKFDRFHEYIFLLAIGWCLGLAELANLLGLSAEIGAFIAGVSIATSPISQYIATSLKPLRDFFLILFFFSVGASFNLNLLSEIIFPALVLTAIVLMLKPAVFQLLLKPISKSSNIGWEIGFRLGQISEFSLLIAYITASSNMISINASHLIQATAILSFLLSSYIVILNFPSPIAISDRLRRD